MIADTILRQVPGAVRHVLPMPGGRHNELLRIDSDVGSFVLRRRRTAQDPPGVDRRRELLAQTAAARAGLAPRVFAGEPREGWLLMELVAGAAWSAADFTQRTRLVRLGETLAMLHAVVPPSCAGFDAVGIADGQLARIAAADPQRARDLAAAMTELTALTERLQEHARGAVLNHGDLDAANLLGPTPLLIDWEYAQVADPLYDIACILAYYPAAAGDVASLLGAAGLGDPASARRLPLQRRQFELLNLLWQQAEGAAGRVPAPGS